VRRAGRLHQLAGRVLISSPTCSSSHRRCLGSCSLAVCRRCPSTVCVAWRPSSASTWSASVSATDAAQHRRLMPNPQRRCFRIYRNFLHFAPSTNSKWLDYVAVRSLNSRVGRKRHHESRQCLQPRGFQLIKVWELVKYIVTTAIECLLKIVQRSRTAT